MNDERTTGGAVARREEFGAVEQTSQYETAAAAVAEQAKAEVNARYIMAERKPRDMDDVRHRLLKACKRPRFAEGALYAKPVGGKSIEGPSIRFAEEALRSMGNLLPQTLITYDDEEKLLVRVMLTELETNLTWIHEVLVKKTIERKKLRKGQKPLEVRTNNYGDTVYLVRATDDDILNKVNSQVSKAMRNHTLRVLPSDIKEECIDEIRATLRKADKQDPDAAKKKLLDAFGKLGVKPSEIVGYLGHDLDKITTPELAELREMHSAIREGEATWADYLDADPDGDGEPQDTQADKVKAKLAAKKGAAKKVAKGAVKKSSKAAAKKQPQDPPEVIDGPPRSATNRGAEIMVESYEAACKAITAWKINKMLNAAALPIDTLFEDWSNDELVFGLQLTSEVIESEAIPATPEAPHWMDKDQQDEWLTEYMNVLETEKLIDPSRLL